MTPQPPHAAKRPETTHVHGIVLHDDYAWLKADNWRDVLRDPSTLPVDIRFHLEAENDYANAVLKPVRKVEALMLTEMRGRIKEDDSTIPAPFGAYAYASRFRAGGQHRIVYRIDGAGGSEHVLIDGDALAAGLAFFSLGHWAPSPDHRLLAYGSDDRGSEFYTIRIIDTITGALLPDTITNTTGDMVWSSDQSSLFYVHVDENHRPRRVLRHIIGSAVEKDAVIYAEEGEGWFVNLHQTQSSRFLVIEIADHDTSEGWLIDLTAPAEPPRLIEPRRTGIRYEIEHQGDHLIILTNADGAEDFKLVTAPVATPSAAHWRDLVPHKPGTMIRSITAYQHYLVRLERENALPRIVIRHSADGSEHAISFPEEAYSLALDPGFEYATQDIRFVYSSMTTPAETYTYDMLSRTRRLLKQQVIPSGHDPARYVTRRLFATASDGAEVPVTLLHRADIQQDGSAPCLLYGYGAYGIAIPASFDPKILSLVDRGFVFAIAHVRGGTEKGWRWYLDGKMAGKPKTFSDFVSVADHLVAEGFTASGRIVAQGRSAGGMLMGAMANHPSPLFKGIIAEVPFVDVLNTMLDTTLPLTPPEWPEWGNPAADRATFELIRSYSPYDQIKPQLYPSILAVAGLTDPRVTYWESAKWIAKIRDQMTGGGPVLSIVDMTSGHGGSGGRFDRLREVAQSYAFAIGVIDGTIAPGA